MLSRENEDTLAYSDTELFILLRELKAEHDPNATHVVPAADLAAALAEREYWQKDSAAAWNKCEERRLAQVKAEAERDEALGLLERLLNDTAHMQSKHAAKMNREIAALLAKAGAGHGGRG